MDPQQRLMLEVAYESLEKGDSSSTDDSKAQKQLTYLVSFPAAGIGMSDIVGSQTSCYVGCFAKDYSNILDRDTEDNLTYTATGTGTAMLSNRLSWFFDLKGPSVSIDTACSSSLVALHLACQSLRAGESKMVSLHKLSVLVQR